MKTAVAQRMGGAVEIAQAEIPEPKGHEILVQLKASGCCHTDVHAVHGDWPTKANFPLTPGHEGVGSVVKVGCCVQNFKVGDRVGIPWLHSTCGECEFCCTGWETLCPQAESTGYSVPGCMSQYATAVATHAVRIPAELSCEEAAPILCAGLTSYKAIKETNTRAGQWIAIVGAGGGLGHLAIQYAVAMGLRVAALDMAEKLPLCVEMGAELALPVGCATTEDATLCQRVCEATGGGAHGVLCVATHPSAFRDSIRMCRTRGTVVFVGMPGAPGGAGAGGGALEAVGAALGGALGAVGGVMGAGSGSGVGGGGGGGQVTLPIVDIILKGLTIKGSLVGNRQDLREALDFAARGLVRCKLTLAGLEEVGGVLERLERDEIEGRVVLTME